jgi:UDP:flavonoid glycosyltransferase YjiC (YdhE family)
MKYLFVTWDGGGNLAPELGVARALMARGHSVHVLADPTCEAEVRAAGCEFTRWTTAPHRLSRRREDDIVKDYETKSPLSMMSEYLKVFLAEPAPRWVSDTLGAIDEVKPDALMVDFAVPSALVAAEARGLPCALAFPNIWMLPTPGIPPFGNGFFPATNVFGRMRDAFIRTMTARLFNKALPPFNRERIARGLLPLPHFFEQWLRANRVLVLTTPRFDFTSDAMPKHVRYVGPQLDDPSWTEEWRSPWGADDERPLVLVSLSSTFQNQVSTLNAIVAALSTMAVRAIVTIGLALDPSEVRGAENVVVVKTAPHHAILPRAQLAIIHCGHGTTLKALMHGVPLVCLPMGRDQNDTATRVVHHGAGVQLKPSSSPEKIRAAIEEVLRNPKYREGARRLASAIANHEGCVDAVDELEAIVSESLAAKPSADPPATRAAGIVASAHS